MEKYQFTCPVCETEFSGPLKLGKGGDHADLGLKAICTKKGCEVDFILIFELTHIEH